MKKQYWLSRIIKVPGEDTYEALGASVVKGITEVMHSISFFKAKEGQPVILKTLVLDDEEEAKLEALGLIPLSRDFDELKGEQVKSRLGKHSKIVDHLEASASDVTRK